MGREGGSKQLIYSNGRQAGRRQVAVSVRASHARPGQDEYDGGKDNPTQPNHDKAKTNAGARRRGQKSKAQASKSKTQDTRKGAGAGAKKTWGTERETHPGPLAPR